MNRLTTFLALVLVTAFSGALAHAATAAPLFSQCPAVGGDNGCQYLITVTHAGSSIAVDPSQGSYASNLATTHETPPATDALIGVQNNSSQAVTSLNVTGPIIFEFDGDGICNNASGPVPNGCQTPSGSTSCGADAGPCSFPLPPDEPPNYTEFGAVHGMPAFPNGDVQNGYEGPTTWFSNPGPSPNNSGTVNFSPALDPGKSTYFSLEATPTNALAVLSSGKILPVTTHQTHLIATQTAAGLSRPILYLPSGVRVQSTATLTGGSGQPTGIVYFQLFSDNRCPSRVLAADTTSARAGSLRSNLVLIRGHGTYYWQVIYTGDSANASSATSCGSQVIVIPPVGNVGLPARKRCVSSVTARLHIGRRPARAIEVFVNGKLVGTLSGNKIHLRVRRRETISVITTSVSHAFAKGVTSAESFRQQSRTYRAC